MNIKLQYAFIILMLSLTPKFLFAQGLVNCPPLPGAAAPEADAVSWVKDGVRIFAIGNNTNGLGYQESGFQDEVLGNGQTLTVLNGSSDYSFPSSSSTPGSANTSVGTFANGTLDFYGNYYRRTASPEISQFRVTTAGGFISGNSGHGVYIYPETGAQTGDYYTVNINFTNPVSAFSFDLIDIFDTTGNGSESSYEIYIDGDLVAKFHGPFLGDDQVGTLELLDSDDNLKATFIGGQNIENTFGFTTDNPVSQVSVKHIVVSGGLLIDSHEPHGFDTFAYSSPCEVDSCDASISGYLDTDNDNIADTCDLDDDNDGIPDEIELGCSPSFIDIAQTFSESSNPGSTINDLYPNEGVDIDFTYELEGAANWGFGVRSVSVAGVTGKYIDTQVKDSNFDNGDVAVYTFNFSETVYNLSFKMGGFDNEDRADLVASNNGVNVPIEISDINLSNGFIYEQTIVDSNGSSGNAPSNSVQINVNGAVDNVTITIAKNDGESANATVQIYELMYCSGINSDSDGIPNHLDIDADDDGIPDNVEAQPTIGYDAPSGNGTAMADTNDDGIDDNYGTGLLVLEDTDGDGTPDYLDLDSDNDGLPDIQENGMSNAVSNNDTDTDGLDNNFETSNINDPVLDVNEDIEDPTNLSILPDTDGDLFSGGDLDYRDLFNINPPVSATLDFDGVDDYVVGSPIFSSITQSYTDGVTLMAWIKSDSNGSDANEKFVLGEKNAIEIFITDEAIRARITYAKANNGIGIKYVYRSTTGIERNVWRHVTVSISYTSNYAYLLLDGEQVFSINLTDAVGLRSSLTAEEEVFRMGNTETLPGTGFFKGAIDEVRVFDAFLTEDQVKEIVYQEIENNAGQVKGTVIENNMTSVDWSNLEMYYPLTNVQTNIIEDQSSKGNNATMHNITTIEEQTAPMPFETKQNGKWDDKDTWLHGDIWYIPGDELTQAASFGNDEVITWGIYHLKHDVEITTSLSEDNTPGFYKGLLALGLIVDTNKVFTVGVDNIDLQINVSKYLKLDGTIDLLNDSQLIQTIFSDLVTSSQGKILRRQEGNSSVYWYNYFSSPVGALGATSLSDNNTSTNNANNTDYRINMLKKGDGGTFQFTNAHHETGKVSTRWLYTYKNGVEYWDYAALAINSPIHPGVGYTQKGTGVGSEQQYLFEGKPNNGTIAINVTDTGGSGSVPAVSKTDYLLGNPYASAIDLHKFIDDNAGVIDGTIQLWQQWSGTSHNLDLYDGGYAQVNKTGSVRAYQFVGIEGANNGNQDGTKTPTKYLPVGQGFMTEIVNNGTIVFKNSQRVFIKETDANGSYTNGSVFFKTDHTSKDKNSASQDEEEEETFMQKIRLEFNAVDGPATKRELLLGFSNFTTDDYDYGYDAKNIDENDDDLNLVLDDQNMMIQAYSSITSDKSVPLNFKASGSYNYRIELTQLENIEADQEIYLKDNLTGYYFDLRTDQHYEFSSEEGEFASRFEVVFQEQEESLSTNDADYEYNLIYFQNETNKLFVKGLQSDAKQVMVINMLGQTVQDFTQVQAQTLDNGLQISNLATGTYVVYLKTDTSVKTKKIIIN